MATGDEYQQISSWWLNQTNEFEKHHCSQIGSFPQGVKIPKSLKPLVVYDPFDDQPQPGISHAMILAINNLSNHHLLGRPRKLVKGLDQRIITLTLIYPIYK